MQVRAVPSAFKIRKLLAESTSVEIIKIDIEALKECMQTFYETDQK